MKIKTLLRENREDILITAAGHGAHNVQLGCQRRIRFKQCFGFFGNSEQ